jgi:hypothetical protein
MGASDAGHAKGADAAAAFAGWLPKPTATSKTAANVAVEGTKLIAFPIGLPPGVDAGGRYQQIRTAIRSGGSITMPSPGTDEQRANALLRETLSVSVKMPGTRRANNGRSACLRRSARTFVRGVTALAVARQRQHRRAHRDPCNDADSHATGVRIVYDHDYRERRAARMVKLTNMGKR